MGMDVIIVDNWPVVAVAFGIWFGVVIFGKWMTPLFLLRWRHWAELFAVTLVIGGVGAYAEVEVLAYFLVLAVPAFILAVCVPLYYPEPETRHQIAVYLVLVWFTHSIFS